MTVTKLVFRRLTGISIRRGHHGTAEDAEGTEAQRGTVPALSRDVLASRERSRERHFDRRGAEDAEDCTPVLCGLCVLCGSSLQFPDGFAIPGNSSFAPPLPSATSAVPCRAVRAVSRALRWWMRGGFHRAAMPRLRPREARRSTGGRNCSA